MKINFDFNYILRMCIFGETFIAVTHKNINIQNCVFQRKSLQYFALQSVIYYSAVK